MRASIPTSHSAVEKQTTAGTPAPREQNGHRHENHGHHEQRYQNQSKGQAAKVAPELIPLGTDTHSDRGRGPRKSPVRPRVSDRSENLVGARPTALSNSTVARKSSPPPRPSMAGQKRQTIPSRNNLLPQDSRQEVPVTHMSGPLRPNFVGENSELELTSNTRHPEARTEASRPSAAAITKSHELHQMHPWGLSLIHI